MVPGWQLREDGTCEQQFTIERLLLRALVATVAAGVVVVQIYTDSPVSCEADKAQDGMKLQVAGGLDEWLCF